MDCGGFKNQEKVEDGRRKDGDFAVPRVGTKLGLLRHRRNNLLVVLSGARGKNALFLKAWHGINRHRPQPRSQSQSQSQL